LIMQASKYMYAGVRAQALSHNLLTEIDLERLLTANNADEALLVLQDTFLAPYLAKYESDLAHATDDSVSEAKHLLASIAPDPKLLDLLWIKYDFYNLRTIVKGLRAEQTHDEILTNCFSTGTLSPSVLLKAVESGTLSTYMPSLSEAHSQAVSVATAYEIDIVVEVQYFKALLELSKNSHNKFAMDYVEMHIDLFNIKTHLRSLHLKDLRIREIFVEGGTLGKRSFTSEDTILETLLTYAGKSEKWNEAITEYRDNGSFTLIDKAAEEHIGNFLKTESQKDLFSVAPLFAYFFAQKNHIQIIRAIVRAKQAGIPEAELRFILRQLYV